MPKYESLLIADAGGKLDDDPALKWVEHLGYTVPKKELKSRVKLFMWLDGKRPFFGVSTEKEAEEFVKAVIASEGSLEGFSLMSNSDLAMFSLGRIAYKGSSWQFKRNTDYHQPYYRRLLTVGAPDVIAVTPNVNDSITGTIEVGEPPPSAKPIYFDPIRIELNNADLNSALVERKYLGLESSVCCLRPPVLAEFAENSYFSPASVKCRQGTLDAVRSPPGARSVAMDKIVLQDDPLLRDMLVEGATIDVALSKTQRTKIEFITYKNKNPTSEYRQQYFVGLVPDLGKLAIEVSEVLQADLQECVGNLLVVILNDLIDQQTLWVR